MGEPNLGPAGRPLIAATDAGQSETSTRAVKLALVQGIVGLADTLISQYDRHICSCPWNMSWSVATCHLRRIHHSNFEAWRLFPPAVAGCLCMPDR